MKYSAFCGAMKESESLTPAINGWKYVSEESQYAMHISQCFSICLLFTYYLSR